MNIKQQTTSEVAKKETVMADNKELYLPPPHDISNLFTAVDLSYHSSSNSTLYKRAGLKARLIRYSILSAR